MTPLQRYKISTICPTSDYLTNDRIALDQRGRSPACSLCGVNDSIEHVLTLCSATNSVRSRLLPDLMNTVAMVQPTLELLNNYSSSTVLTQFILDCTSFNLPDPFRIPVHNPRLSEIFQISRDWCFGISSERTRLLKLL